MSRRATQDATSRQTASRLLRWYDAHRRDLPWRRCRDPYALLVSEVMLQQTRVGTVLSHYERFLERFPTLEDLASSPAEAVLAAWSGLGYYQRARRLHAAARRIMERGGHVPRTLDELRELPGIGRYTAAALGSMAFDLVEPAVDGNVERVVARHFGIEGDPRRAATRRQIEQRARRLLDPERPGDSNQALMELGATLCRPRAPRCPRCPLLASCVAIAMGQTEAYPATRRRPQTVEVSLRLAVVKQKDRFLLFRGSEDRRLLPGMWDLPRIEASSDAAAERALEQRYGGRWRLGASFGEVRHAITHHRLRVEVREARLEGGSSVSEGAEAAWFATDELENLPLSSLVVKALAKAGIEPA